MADLRITFNVDNAAYRDPDTGEVAPIWLAHTLHRVTTEVGEGRLSGTIRDPNGNAVGSWDLVPSSDP